MKVSDILRLQSGESVVALCPDVGASIARFRWCGVDIFRPTPDAAMHEGLVRQMGFYPLVPYSNRIGRGELRVGRQDYQLRPNVAPEPHAQHGFGWQRAWQVVGQSQDAAELMLDHVPDADWPFACEAKLNITLADNLLHFTLSVRNTDERVMPAGLGFHPYFPVLTNTRLQARWKTMWEMDQNMLPTERVNVFPDVDFSEMRSIVGWKIDNCFTGWNQTAVIHYPTHRVQIDASPECQQLVCFAPDDGRNFIAIEPVTSINNAFALAANGVADTGMKMLSSGDQLSISMSIRVSAHR